MPSIVLTQLTIQGVPVKAEAVAKAKANTDHSQKAGLQATVPIVAVAIHLNDVNPWAKNATTS